jgi:hypothetical protein
MLMLSDPMCTYGPAIDPLHRCPVLTTLTNRQASIHSEKDDAKELPVAASSDDTRQNRGAADHQRSCMF